MISNNTLTAVLLLVVFLVLCILVLNLACGTTMDKAEWKEETYRVKEGDSLWAISGKYCHGNVDRRDWIAEIQELNGLEDSIIHPGQKLTVLAPIK